MSVFSDFDWSWRGVRVRETGAFIPFSLSLAHDVWRGGLCIICEQLRRPPPGPSIYMHFHPRPPRPWYLLWGALRQAGVKPGAADEANIYGYFEDSTLTDIPASAPNGLNRHCQDISKSRVATVFKGVFGYDLAIDPETATEPFVAKSEINGRHDGRIVNTPCAPEKGWVYQRLIDTRTDDGHVQDIRCPTVYGEVALIYIKERPEDQRFANLNTRCRMAAPEDLLSLGERTNISRFCQEMGLDWGGLDILRDATDQRIYIVDVNKSDMGPPLALGLRDKMQSTRILGKALRAALEARL